MAALLMLLLAMFVYSNTLDAPFVFDDVANIKRNPHVKMTEFSWESLRAAAFDSRDNDRPVAYVSFALNHWVFGSDVAGFHLVNIGIHFVSGVLVYLLALLTLRQLRELGHFDGSDASLAWTAIVAGCLFVAHPIQTQAVTYIVQRMASMATMFYLLALVAYIYGRLATSSKPRIVWWILAMIAWALALGTKQIAATLPLVILLYEWYFFQDLRRAWLKRAAVYIGLPVLACVILIGLFYLDGNPIARLEGGYATRDFTLSERLLTQPRVVVEYVRLLFAPTPTNLNLLHSMPTSRSLLTPMATVFALVFVVGLIGFAFYAARDWRLLSFCLLWFLIHLAIESTVLPLEMIYEHRLYLPMFGVALLLAGGWNWLLHRWQRGAIAAACLVILLLAISARARNAVWADPERLWTDVIQKNSDEYAEAIMQRVRAHNNRGNVRGSRGQLEKALADVDESDRLAPNQSDTLFNRGITHLALAEQQHDASHAQLAVVDFTNALEHQPDDARPLVEAYLHRGRAHRLLGNYEAALRDFSRAREIHPQFAEAAFQLAWVLATCPDDNLRDGQQAVTLARQGCAATAGQDARWLDLLACALAEEGRFDEAVVFATRAAALATGQHKLDCLDRLRRFSAEQPFRDPPA